MKNPERVAILLAELRELADNDFELHRIDVLEHDLIAPPTVEQIDDKHQRFAGVVYTKRKCGHYERAFGVHQIIWAYHNGEIPANNVIHHVDGNPANNDIANLQCLTRGQHTLIHDGNTIYRRKCKICGAEFSTAIVGEIYCSKGCKQASQIVPKHCKFCGKTFNATLRHRDRVYCSQECQLAARKQTRYQLLHNQTERCRFCGKTFESVNRIRGGFCSKSCRNKYRLEMHQEIRICPMCGKEFPAYKYSRAKFCSRACANKYHAANNVLK